MIIASIDYSITCPAIAIFDSSVKFSFENCVFSYYTQNKKNVKTIFPNIFGALNNHPEEESDTARFDRISDWVLGVLMTYKASRVFMEGYSFASKGLVFNIAENAGVLKHKLHKLEIPLTIVPPTTIKKFAIKGNASKEIMYETFVKKTGIDLIKAFGIKRPDSPINDIVDAFFLMNYAVLTDIIA